MSSEVKGKVAAKGKGGAFKHKKVLRDNIHGITKNDIMRLLRKAGVKRVSGLVYEEVRGRLVMYLNTVLYKVGIITQYAHRKTVMLKDLEIALDLMGVNLVAAASREGIEYTSFVKKCALRSTKLKEQRKERKRKAEEEEGKEYIPIKRKAGTSALGEIRYYQKQSDCLVIRKLPFYRVVKEYLQNYLDDPKMTAEFIALFQVVVEDYLVILLSKANKIAISSDRVTLQAKDIIFADRLCMT